MHHDLSLLSFVQNLIRYGSRNCHFFLTLYSLGFVRFTTFLASFVLCCFFSGSLIVNVIVCWFLALLSSYV